MVESWPRMHPPSSPTQFRPERASGDAPAPGVPSPETHGLTTGGKWSHPDQPRDDGGDPITLIHARGDGVHILDIAPDVGAERFRKGPHARRGVEADSSA